MRASPAFAGVTRWKCEKKFALAVIDLHSDRAYYRRMQRVGPCSSFPHAALSLRRRCGKPRLSIQVSNPHAVLNARMECLERSAL